MKEKIIRFRDKFWLFKAWHKRYEKSLQKQYNGPKDITLLASNCIAGEIYHDLGLPFLSPTINLWMVQPDFLKFVLDLDYYLDSDLMFNQEKKDKYKCPVADLGTGDKKITLIFLHYKSDFDAKEKWNERKKRINRDKICLLMSDRDGINADDMRTFSEIKCYRKVLFTYKDYPQYDFTFKLEKDPNRECVRNYQMKKWNGFWRYESQFNAAKWLNGAESWK